MDKDIEPVLALMPVTFHYKSDNKGTPQFGLIAEQVAKVNPDLVVRDRDGEIYSVRYEGGERHVAQRVPKTTPDGSRTEKASCRT